VCVYSREIESNRGGMDNYLSTSGQYEDISDQENESDFKEPAMKQPTVQKDPFNESVDREDRKEKNDRHESDSRKKIDR